MKSFVYFKLEFKKMIKSVPGIIAGMLILLGLILGISYFGAMSMENSGNSFKALRVGIVGSEDDKYVKLAIATVENMDTVKSSFIFDYCNKEELEEGLDDGTYNLAFIFPDNYVDGLLNGENKDIVVRFGKGDTELSFYVFSQLSNVASTLLMESERNVYSMEDYYDAHMPDLKHDAWVDINIRYFNEVLGRADTFMKEKLSVTDNMTMQVYYFCDAIVLLFMLAGLQCAGLLSDRDKVFEKKLQVAGIGTIKRLLAKLLALTLTFLSLYLIFGIFAVVTNEIAAQNNICIIDKSPLELALSLGQASLVILPICTLVLCVYEIVGDRVIGVFTLFILVISLGIISGCFYPIYFLPNIIQKIAEFTLPRVMFKYVSGCVTNQFSLMVLTKMSLHALALFVLMVVAEKIRDIDSYGILKKT